MAEHQQPDAARRSLAGNQGEFRPRPVRSWLVRNRALAIWLLGLAQVSVASALTQRAWGPSAAVFAGLIGVAAATAFTMTHVPNHSAVLRRAAVRVALAGTAISLLGIALAAAIPGAGVITLGAAALGGAAAVLAMTAQSTRSRDLT